MRHALGLGSMVALREGLTDLLSSLDAAARLGSRPCVKSVFLLLALPPNCFLYLALVGLLIAPRYRRLGYAATCVGLLTLTLLAMPVVSNAMLVGLEQGLPLMPPANDMPQAIVIPRRRPDPRHRSAGCDVRTFDSGSAARRRRFASPHRTAGAGDRRDRATGPSRRSRISWPPACATIFRVPVRWVEDASVDTWQNASLSAEILRQGEHSFGLCRDPGVAYATRRDRVPPLGADRDGGADLARTAARSRRVRFHATRVIVGIELLRVARVDRLSVVCDSLNPPRGSKRSPA